MRNVDSLYDSFQNDNALMHYIISKLFTDTDFYCHVEQRKSMQDYQAVSRHL